MPGLTVHQQHDAVPAERGPRGLDELAEFALALHQIQQLQQLQQLQQVHTAMALPAPAAAGPHCPNASREDRWPE